MKEEVILMLSELRSQINDNYTCRERKFRKWQGNSVYADVL